jgi:hypothetical protein
MLLLQDDIDNREEFYSLDIIDHQENQKKIFHFKILKENKHTIAKMFEEEC